MKLQHLLFALVVAGLCACPPLAADFLTIYGSPPYDFNTGGYQGQGATAFYFNGGVVETIQKYGPGVGGGQGSRAVRWEKSGAFVELARLGNASNGEGDSGVNDVNAAGIAVGSSQKFVLNVSKGSRAVRWDASGAVSELGNLGTSADGKTSAGAIAVNALGVIAGSSDKYVGGVKKGEYAVRWSASGTATELGNLGGDANLIANNIPRDINDSGTVVGAAYKYISGVDSAWRAVRWDGSSTIATELGTLGTDPDPNGSSSYDNLARKINNAGMVIGESDKFERGFFLGIRPVRWGPGGTAATELVGLGTSVNGSTQAAAESINSSGMIAGWADRYGADGIAVGEHAAVWGLNGVAIDLNDFVDPASGWVQLNVAHRIDDNNWVTGLGVFDPDGAGPRVSFMRDFLMQIPEPSALMLIGSVAFALQTRMRKRTQGGS